MTTTAEKIAVMQAFAGGKIVQFRPIPAQHNDWRDVDDPNWDWRLCDFRIKPEPREWWGVLFADGRAFSLSDSEREARLYACEDMPVVRLREVIEP